MTGANSTLSSAFCSHFLNFISRRSFSVSFNHLHLGLLILLPVYSKTFLNYTSMIHSYSLFFIMSATVSEHLYNSRNYGLLLALHIPCSITGPCILLNIFLFHVFSLLLPLSVTGHVLTPHTTTGFTIDRGLQIYISMSMC